MAGPIATTSSTPSPEFRSFLQIGVYQNPLHQHGALQAALLAAAAARRAAERCSIISGAKFPELAGQAGGRPARLSADRQPRRLLRRRRQGFSEARACRRCATTSVARPIRPVRFRPATAMSRPRRSRTDRRMAPRQRRAAAGRAGRHDGRRRRRDLAGRGQEQDRSSASIAPRAIHRRRCPATTRSQALIDRARHLRRQGRAKQVRLTAMRNNLVEKHCSGCHSDFGLKAGPVAMPRRTRPCCASCCRRTAGSIPAIPRVRQAAHAAARHRRGEDDAAGRREPAEDRARLRGCCSTARSVRRENGSGERGCASGWPAAAQVLRARRTRNAAKYRPPRSLS